MCSCNLGCITCPQKAKYVSRNSELAFCEECYIRVKSTYDKLLLLNDFEGSFEEYYDIEEVKSQNEDLDRWR